MIKRPLLVNAFDDRAAHQSHPNLIMVTSAVQGEGKTFTTLNLAVSITMELDSTVLLVDADVARPGLSRTLGIDGRPGLLERLASEQTGLAGLLLRTDIPKLTVLPAGRRHKRSTELLASGGMRRLLDELASRYSDRIVLFDSPPLLETSEASVLASQMGQVVIVVESESTSQVLVKESVAQFENTENVYLVLNKCRKGLFAGHYGYGYGYGYGYYGE
jgi:protein-tyrosine kinase